MTEKLLHCKNDGTKLTGDYCHTCGQRADEPRRAVIGLVQDVFIDTLAIDGKLARTIFLLLSRPGRLARRYLDGKRVSYSPPFRMYLFSSVFFFLAMFSIADFAPVDTTDLALNEEAMSELEMSDPVVGERLRNLAERQSSEKNEAVDAGEGAAEEATDAVTLSFNESSWEDIDYSGPAWLELHLKRMFEATQRAVADPRLFVSESRQNLPRVLLLAPILYAVVLLLIYAYRRKFYAYDHFVISLYMHAALYAYLLLAMLLSHIPFIGGWLWFLPLLWGWGQPFVVFRQAYGSGWVSAFLKWAISISIYAVVLLLIVTFGLTYSLYQS